MFGNENRAMRTLAWLMVQVDIPVGQGFTFASIVCIPLNAHWNSVGDVGQLLSVVAIDPVASSIMAMFHEFACPPMDAVAWVATGIDLIPKIPMK
jgi:hypothetical protein